MGLLQQQESLVQKDTPLGLEFPLGVEVLPLL